MKTSIKLSLLALLAAAGLVGCNKDENGVDELQNGELRLTSGVNTLTRSFGIDEQINAGQTVAVYVDKADGTQLHANNVLTAVGNGAFTGGEKMYFPSDKSNVNIYAFAVNATVTESGFPTSAITHSVKADQTQISDYATSDLLYAARQGVGFTKNDVTLTFYHLLSKVEVALKSGSGSPDLSRATVTIAGTRLKADFTPSKDADINSSTAATAETARAGMITVSANDNNAAPITIGTKISTDDFGTGNTDYAEAVIVPQTVASGTEFIKVRLANGGTTYTYKLEDAAEFKSGKKYQYKITVNNTRLTVSSSIENWGTGGDKTGTAEMD